MAKVSRLFESDLDGFIPGLAGSSCAFGVFDGLHVGHMSLIGHALEVAALEDLPSAVLTFDVDPDELFRSDLHKLCANGERIERLAATGVDEVVVLPFTRSFASLGPQEFLAKVLQGMPKVLHVGCDFRFGSRAAGTVEELNDWAHAMGTRVCSHSLVKMDDVPVTATRIRELLSVGRVEQAAELLGRPYAFTGMVEPGRQQGREMGFRTANLSVPASLHSIGEGVYACYGLVGDHRYKAAVSVGVAPTFEDATATCEVHLLDFQGDLYSQPLTVEFMHWLRPMKKFDSTEELIATVMGNIQWCRDNL
ncbi:MAG: riboflavin biosynthesis protein RibF [Coriobacteriia bacterium]|nr:riboflavin biosynthesis protein RibF [Coriobacteriia bacterium]